MIEFVHHGHLVANVQPVHRQLHRHGIPATYPIYKLEDSIRTRRKLWHVMGTAETMTIGESTELPSPGYHSVMNGLGVCNDFGNIHKSLDT